MVKPVDYCFKTPYDPEETPLTEADLQLMLFRHGPIQVGIGTTEKNTAFFETKSSYWDGSCGNEVADHSVLLVGWDETTWTIKNSWDTDWGNGGYIRLPRGQNKCGIQTTFLVPLLAHN